MKFRALGLCLATAALVGGLAAPAQATNASEPSDRETATSSAGEEFSGEDVYGFVSPNSEGTEGSGRLEDAGSYDIATPKAAPTTGRSDFGTNSVVGSDDRFRPAFSGKYTKAAYIEATDSYGAVQTTCSGFLVANNYLLTAGHCVHPGGGGNTRFYTHLDVFPGYAGGSNMRCYNVQTWASTAWIESGDAAGDWGLIKLSCTAGSTFGYLGMNSSTGSVGNTVEVFGYPGDKPRKTLWSARGPITRAETYFWYHQADTAGGQSGGPVMLNNTASIGIHIQGFTGLRGSENLAIRFRDELLTTIKGIIAS